MPTHNDSFLKIKVVCETAIFGVTVVALGVGSSCKVWHGAGHHSKALFDRQRIDRHLFRTSTTSDRSWRLAESRPDKLDVVDSA